MIRRLPGQGTELRSLGENFTEFVIPSEARNLALNLFKAVRDSSSPAAPRNDRLIESSQSYRP